MSRGLDRERRVLNALEEQGWGVGSRRHVGGPGDLLAVSLTEVRLIEVKSTLRPYSHFHPADRAAMIEFGKLIGADPWLYWWPKGRGTWEEIPPADWPAVRTPQPSLSG